MKLALKSFIDCKEAADAHEKKTKPLTSTGHRTNMITSKTFRTENSFVLTLEQYFSKNFENIFRSIMKRFGCFAKFFDGVLASDMSNGYIYIYIYAQVFFLSFKRYTINRTNESNA